LDTSGAYSRPLDSLAGYQENGMKGKEESRWKDSVNDGMRKREGKRGGIVGKWR